MVLKGVDEIDWFTDRPFRSEGLWKPQKLLRKWDNYFATSEPNAQASFKVGEERELITFEMFKPKFNNKKQRLSFNIDAGIINERENDLVTGLKGKALDEVTLFIDDAVVGQYNGVGDADYTLEAGDTWQRWLQIGREKFDVGMIDCFNSFGGKILIGADQRYTTLEGGNFSFNNLSGANLLGANLKKADLTNANLYQANLAGADLSYANLKGARMTRTILFDAIWEETTCPDGTLSGKGGKPCTAEQLNFA